MESISVKDKFIAVFSAFTLSNSSVINLLNYNGMESIGTIVSSYCLYIMTFISLLFIFYEKRYWKSSIIVAISFYLLVLYERHVDMYHTVSEFESGFLIHGLGGFFIGFTIKNIKLFVRYLSILSAIYSLVLIVEPITHSILHMDEMLTGYLMTGLTINLILSYYTVFEKNKFILTEAIVSSVIITLFTARGCGLALIGAWCFFYFWNKKSQGASIGKSLSKFLLFGVIAYLTLSYLVDFILGTGIELEAGSLLEKLANGYANTSNGRDDVWEIGLGLLYKSPLTGIGFGADRTVAEIFFVHNILLEMCINFGIPLAIVLLLCYWSITIKGMRISIGSILSYLIIAQIFKTWVQLLFSSSYLNTMLPLMFIMGLAMQAIIKQYDIKNE